MKYSQLPLIAIDEDIRNGDSNRASSGLIRQSFSHDNICVQEARLNLEKQYASLLEETGEFNRKLVSYQGNKGALVHGWIRYKEGFSAQLVESLIRKFGIGPGETILDPFAGSATTLLVAKTLGINAAGIELLPPCHLAWEAKSFVMHYDLDELRTIYRWVVKSEPHTVSTRFPHIAITKSAFPLDTENDIMFYTSWFENLDISKPAKTLCKLLLTGILEEVSYTRKDGQYLRWDYRSEKIKKRNQMRTEQGKKPIKKVDMGFLPSVKEALLGAFEIVLTDISQLQQNLSFDDSCQELIKGNSLLILPTLEAERFASVITSPPYCNRYDYTRTYALEIVYLQPDQDIREFRQGQLSCTVENRPKLDALKAHYKALGNLDRYNRFLNIVQDNPVFIEINQALQTRWQRGQMNNRGVLSMVEQYFIELGLVFGELYRICKRGSHIAFVNDNVRYGGEVIPVDLLTTNLAEAIGFKPIKVYVLPQRKGNSSQQMGKFGREPLRKSITIWKKD